MRKTDVIAPLLTSKPRSLRGSKDFWSAETRTRQKLSRQRMGLDDDQIHESRLNDAAV